MPTRSQRHLREIQGKDSSDQSNVGGVPAPPPTDAVAFYGSVPDQTHTQNVAGFSLDVSGFFSGTDTPFTYTVQAGTLPTGLTLGSGTGIISGTPTVVENQTGIVIRATDVSTDTADSNAFAINIVAP